MKSKANGFYSISLCCLALSGTVFAGAMGGVMADPNHFDLIGAGGVANLMAGDGFLGVTSSETDRLVQTNRNAWNTFTGQVGLAMPIIFTARSFTQNRPNGFQ